MTTPPPADLPTLIEAHIHAVHGILKDGCKDFMPKLLVQLFDFQKQETEMHLIALAIDINDHDEKRTTMENLGRKYYAEQKVPLGIALACEAWTSQEACDKDGKFVKQPSQCDDRKEILLISAMSIDQSVDLQIMPIEREENGNIKPSAFVKNDEIKANMPLLMHFFRGFAMAHFNKEGARR